MIASLSARLPSVAALLALGLSAPAFALPIDHEGPEAQLTAADSTQARAGAATASQILQRFSPVGNAFALPGAPRRTEGLGEGAAQGLAGGDMAVLKGWSLWGSVVGGSTQNSFAPEQQKGTVWTLSTGADRPISETTTMGVSLTFTHEGADTAFGTGTRSTNSVYLAPYASFKLNDWLSADVTLGYGHTDTNQKRDFLGTPVTGSHSSHSLFGAANLTASKWHGATLLSGVVGLSGSSTRRGSFTESDGTVNLSSKSQQLQARIGGTIGYYMEPMLPYLSVEYIYDLKQERSLLPGAPNDRDEFRVTLGSHIYGTGANKNLSGGFAVSHSFNRSDKKATNVSLNLRLAF